MMDPYVYGWKSGKLVETAKSLFNLFPWADEVGVEETEFLFDGDLDVDFLLLGLLFLWGEGLFLVEENLFGEEASLYPNELLFGPVTGLGWAILIEMLFLVGEDFFGEAEFLTGDLTGDLVGENLLGLDYF